MTQLDPQSPKQDGLPWEKRVDKHLADAVSKSPVSSLDNVIAQGAGAVGLVVKRSSASETTDLLQVQDETGAVLGGLTASGGVIGGSQTFLPASNGVDDTAAIQAILNLAGSIAGKRGASYITSSPLVLYSSTELDMTGCTVTLKAGSNCRMVQTDNFATGRTVADGVTTAASTTMTSATAVFTAADVGKPITIAGAGTSGATLFTTIASVTNGTTVVLTDAAGATTSAANVGIGPRSSDIHIVGGLWDRGANSGATGADRHSIVFRKVDRCSIIGAKFASTGGKFAVLFVSVTDWLADRLWMESTASDGVHVNGPALRGSITRIIGTCGDDMVSLVPIDNAGYTWGDEGDITDYTVEGVYGNNSSQQLVKTLGGVGLNNKRGTIRTVRGSCQHHGVLVGDGADTNEQGGLIDGISVEDVKCSPGSGFAHVYLNGTNMKRVGVDGLYYELGARTGQFAVLVESTASIGSLRIGRLTTVDGQASVGAVRIKGTVTRFQLKGAIGTLVASAFLVELNGVAHVTSCLIGDVEVGWATHSGALLSAITSGVTLTEVEFSNILCPTVGSDNPPTWLADLISNTIIRMTNVKGTSRLQSRAGLLTVWAHSSDTTNNNHSLLSTGTIASKAFGFWTDVALLTQTAGDMAYNTNAASGPTGPVISDGTRWQSAANGAVATGTAVLVAGTVTVTNASITANSIIRVARKTIGGTPGALYVSALTASTSFAITSTNGADTSTVYYEIVAY